MIHLGDITKIRGCVAPVVDVMIGGSPCQDLSIAGKRAGFSGERSVLLLEQIRVTKEMRYVDSLRGRTGEFIRPRYMVWENVPGAFSSNRGKDFGAVLTEMVRVVEPEAPTVPMPKAGWPNSGCLHGMVSGGGGYWSIAWRILDAQFWGVPQRRRRIVLVADFGGRTAPEILFVRKGLSGDTEPGSEKRKGFAESSESGAAYAVRVRGGCDGGGKGALVQEEKSGTLGCNNDQTIFCNITSAGFSASMGAKAGNIGYEEEKSPTLSAARHDATVLCLNDQGGNVMGISQDISGTLRAQEHGHQPLVTVFDPAQITSPVNRSRPEPGKPCHTLTSRMGTGGGNVPIMFRQQRFGSYDLDNVAGTCQARDGKDGTANLVCAVDCRHGTENPETNGTLQAKSTGGQSLNLNNVVREAMTVRRLTPLECERLQGFPDGWTDIGEWVDSKGKTRKTTDSARYKALGNSIALPPWKWVLKRLCAQYERDATMASLFDGIGGFPLIWEQLNGKGSCLWASEIEEFPMAVTKKQFGGMK